MRAQDRDPQDRGSRPETKGAAWLAELCKTAEGVEYLRDLQNAIEKWNAEVVVNRSLPKLKEEKQKDEQGALKYPSTDLNDEGKKLLQAVKHV